MLKETISYTDYNGVERKEDFYFNLTKAELAQMELSTAGGMSTKLRKIIDAKEYLTLVSLFKDIVCDAYGEKSDDGKRFIKSKEITEAFTQTEAYSNLYMKLVGDTDYAVKFIKGILPAEYIKELETQIEAK